MLDKHHKFFGKVLTSVLSYIIIQKKVNVNSFFENIPCVLCGLLFLES